MLSLSNKFWKVLILSSLTLTCSCYSKSDEANVNFKKKYGKDVNKINSRRDKMDISNQKNEQALKDQRLKFEMENAKSSYARAIQVWMPSDLGQGRQLPDDMFVIDYNLQNFPDSYAISKLSFDDITIPRRDAFGVETDLGEKNYQLVDRKTLQKDFDLTKQSINREDREISAELIGEEKQARRKGHPKKQIDYETKQIDDETKQIDDEAKQIDKPDTDKPYPEDKKSSEETKLPQEPQTTTDQTLKNEETKLPQEPQTTTDQTLKNNE
jgi:hypothetical protein